MIDMLADGWIRKVAGSCRHPVKQPTNRKFFDVLLPRMQWR